MNLIIIFLSITYTKQWGIWNCIFFFLLCAIIPIGTTIILFKNKKRFWVYLIVILLIVIFCSDYYLSNSVKIEDNFETYLSQDDDFVKNAKLVMPAQETLNNNCVVFYNYIKKEDMKVYFLTVRYEDDDFLYEKDRLAVLDHRYIEKVALTYINRDDFFWDGKLYHGMVYNNNGYYSIAYHICDDNTVSYIFLKYDLFLQTMTMGQTLSCIFDNRVYLP